MFCLVSTTARDHLKENLKVQKRREIKMIEKLKIRVQRRIKQKNRWIISRKIQKKKKKTTETTKKKEKKNRKSCR